MNNKITRQAYEELDLIGRLGYLRRSDLWGDITDYFEIHHTNGNSLSECVWDKINYYDGDWEVLAESLMAIKEVTYHADIVYQDIENDCWDEFHELTIDELDSIVDSFYMYDAYDDLFAKDENTFDGMETLL